MRAVKIAFVVNAFPVASETFIVNQAVALSERGHTVDIFCAPPAERYRRRDPIGAPLQITHFPAIPESRRARIALAARSFIRGVVQRPSSTLRALDWVRYGTQAASLRFLFAGQLQAQPQRYDVIHAHFGTLGLVGLYLTDNNLLQGPLAVTFYGADATVSPRKWGRHVYRPLRGRCHVFAISEHIRRRVAELGFSEEKIEILRLGVRLNEFKRSAREMPGHNDVLQLCSVARLVEKKGIGFALSAIRILLGRGQRVHYRIAGDGPLMAQFQARVQAEGLRNHVELLGWQDRSQIRDLLETSHLMIVPSVTASNGDEEGQGVVIQEAQATGLNVIATRHNGFPEGLRDGETGFLVPERDPMAIAEAVERFIAGRQHWPEWSTRAREFVDQRFSLDRITERQLELYRRVAQSHHG